MDGLTTLWDVSQDHAALDIAIRAYERGFYLRNDYYDGINFAYLLNVHTLRFRYRPPEVVECAISLPPAAPGRGHYPGTFHHRDRAVARLQ